MKTNVWLRRLIVVLLVLVALWMAITEKYSFTPETTFTTITGDQLSLKTLRGKPVIVTFWATSCQSCITEIPDLIALYKQFHSQGLEMIAIAMVYDPPNRVVAMANEQKLPYRIVLDTTAELAKAFGRVWATPTTVLIGTDGIVIKNYIGPFDLMDMQNRIEHLLK